MSRFLKDRQILLLGGAPDAELQKILNHQKELFDVVRQSTHSHHAAEMSQESVRRLAAVIQ
jgi:hypothetical protein